MLLKRVTHWALGDLPHLNRAILEGREAPETLNRAVNVVVGDLPEPPAMEPADARRLVVDLGLAGVSVARHYQEIDPLHKATPEAGFEPLVVGSAHVPFLRYFGALADRTATGHPHRDSYASLVRWNLPTTTVSWAGETLATIPGAFADDSVHTYTGDPSEGRFFRLLKDSETVERAVNTLLAPLSDGSVDILDVQARHRVRRSTTLLGVLRRLSVDFAALPPAEGLRPDHFLDVFRQFAVHWRVDDIPPSGALDPEALERDLLLGLAMPDYPRLVHRVYPSLLGAERAKLDLLLERPTLPTLLLRRFDLRADKLRSLPLDALAQLLRRSSTLADWFVLLEANARVAGAHLMLSRKYLFQPQQARDASGLGDRTLVSNRRGTTGMDETILARLTQARRHHDLAAFRSVARGELVDRVHDSAPAARDADVMSVRINAVPVRGLRRRPGADRAAASTVPVGPDDQRLWAVPR
jgi:hypothetical protein